MSGPAVRGEESERDWNAVLSRALAPFRSEEAAFRVLLLVVAVVAVLVGLVLLVRAVV